MDQLHYNKTPVSVYESLTKISNIHQHHRRNVDKIEYFLPKVNKSIGQGQFFSFRGINLWAETKLLSGVLNYGQKLT